MKIGYFGDGPWSHLALRRLHKSNHATIAFIVARHKPDPVLEGMAKKLGLPFYHPEQVNAPDFICGIKQHAADLFVSMSFDQILKRDIRDAAPLGFINCHAGALPFYRGRNILNWVLINGESRFGVTVHHVDDGIDTGDIIVQKFANIGPDDTYADLLERAYPLCAEAIYEAVTLLETVNPPRQRQSEIHPIGSYFGRRLPGDERIDWSWSSERLHNFVRAITLPGPGARCQAWGKEIAVLKTERIPDALAYIATCGEVIGRSGDHIIAKTGDSSIAIKRIAPINADGSLGEPITPRLPIGTRLIGL